MTVVVKEVTKDLAEGVANMAEAMIEDYKLFNPSTKSDIAAKMNEEYANSFEVKYGSKYVKILAGSGVTAFIVKTDKDKKFKKGDILKPAGFNAPARNGARGNIFDGNYPINWTGPLYLR
jgi:hypothetical protein